MTEIELTPMASQPVSKGVGYQSWLQSDGNPYSMETPDLVSAVVELWKSDAQPDEKISCEVYVGVFREPPIFATLHEQDPVYRGMSTELSLRPFAKTTTLLQVPAGVPDGPWRLLVRVHPATGGRFDREVGINGVAHAVTFIQGMAVPDNL